MPWTSDSEEDDSPHRTLIDKSRLRRFPCRYTFTLLGFVGFMLAYAYKVVLSVTMVAMVAPGNITVQHLDDGHCPEPDLNGTLSQEPVGTYNWNRNQQSLVLGSFFYGYVITQIPAGRLSEIFGSKWIIGGSILIPALASLLLPVAAEAGFVALVIVRIVQGLALGASFPSMHAMIARWTPKYERGLVSTIIYTGAQIGTVISLPIAGVLSESTFLGGWPSVYYLLGVAGIVWFGFWSLLVYNCPDQHPYITTEELHYIQADQGEEKCQCGPVPWKKILTSVPVWALILTNLGQNWGFLTILTEMPTYLKDVLHFGVEKNGIVSSLPYLLQAFSAWTVGYFGDRLRKSGKLNVNSIRKISNTIGFIGPAICLIGITLAGCNSTLIVAYLILALGLNGFTFSGFLVTHVDMAPDFAGTLMGMSNGIGNLAGFLGPAVVGALTNDNQTMQNWAIVFYICAAVYAVSSVIYIVFASADLQSWGVSKKEPVLVVVATDGEDNCTSFYNNNTNGTATQREARAIFQEKR